MRSPASPPKPLARRTTGGGRAGRRSADAPGPAPRDLARRVAEARDRGEHLAALDALRDVERRFPRNLRLRRLLAQARASVGAAREALGLLDALVAEGHRDVETLGLRARALKDLADQTTDPALGRRRLADAFAAYLEAHAAHPQAYWPGLNAAGLALRLGLAGPARRLARAVLRRCRRAAQGRRASLRETYWRLASQAEAALVLGDRDEAVRGYGAAVSLPGVALADRARTLHNARRILEVRPGARAAVEACFAQPPVLVVCGHMLDRPGRRAPRLPRESEDALRAGLRAALARRGPAIVYGSCAAGADLLAMEEAQALGLETHVVLPYERLAFRRDCVDYLGDRTYGRRFDAVLRRARPHVQAVSDQPIPEGSSSVEFANTVVFGLALAHARRLESRVQGLAVFDGRRGDGSGGTQWIVERLWRPHGVPVEVLAPPPLAQTAAGPSRAKVRRTVGPRRGALRVATRAVLFADVQGFSRLSEAQVPAFVRHVLGAAAALAREPRFRIEMRNTWGDGLAFVFESVEQAGVFGLDLVERVHAVRGLSGLPRDLDLRVGLNAGPVHAFRDPVTGQPGRSGRHVVLAARLEPVTPAGCVYATQAFAALAEVEGVAAFSCEYVGRVLLAKRAGRHPVYRLRRVERGG